MPAAFTVANSPITQAGILAVTGAGTAAQYIDGTGALQTFTSYEKWILAGDAGVQDITAGQTASILGGTDIGTIVASPRTLTINHSAVTRSNTTATASPNPGDTVDLVSGVSSSTTGHVTGVETTTVTWPDNQNTTYTIDVPTTTTSINLKGSDSTDDPIALVGGTNITITRDSDSSLTWDSLNTEYTAGIGLTLNTLEFDVNVDATAGNAPESLSTDANKTYAIQLDNNSTNLVVNVPWDDTIQTITGAGTDNTDSGVLLSDSGGTVLILGSGSVTAAQAGNTITLTGTDTDTGITGVTLATADSAGAPLVESITNRELTLTSAKYIGGANVGYVPEGGTSSTYLKGDGTWEAIPTGLIFKGTWDASGGSGGSPDLTLAANKGSGFLWICDVAGTAYPNGGTNEPSTWALGDWCVYDGSAWTRVPATNSGVTSITTTDGSYIDLTPNAATTGAVTVTADLSATGTKDATTFLRGDNTWDVPSYTVDTTYTVDVPTATTSINLKGSDGTDDAIVLTSGTNVTLSRTDASTIDIAATNTTYTAGNGLNLSGTVFSADINNTQANAATQALDASPPADRFYAVQLDNNATVADADLVVNIPWTDTQNPNQTLLGVGSDNTNSGVILNESGGTVLILGATGVAAAQASNTVTLTGTTYDINFQENAGASPQVNPFLRLTGTGTASGTTDLEIVGTGATTVTRNSDNKITINSAAGSYFWKVRDSSDVDETVLNTEYLQFVTATGALATDLTGTGTNTDPYVMTLTSPNTTYSNFTAAQPLVAGASGLVVAPPAGAQGKFLRGDATWVSETTYSTFTGADGTTAGTSGLVPAPAAADNVKFLKGDGTWAATPQGDITEIKVTAPITGAATSGIATIGINTMGAATASAAGTKGAVPAPAAGEEAKFLRADATWETPTDTNTNTTYTIESADSKQISLLPSDVTVTADSAGNYANVNVIQVKNIVGTIINGYAIEGGPIPAGVFITNVAVAGSNRNLTLSQDVSVSINTPLNIKARTAVTLADGTGISIAGNNDTITITNVDRDTGLPAIIVDDAQGNMSFGNTNVTAATVRAQIGAGTGDGDVTASSTTTFTNKSGSNSQWTNDEGYTTNTGTTTANNTQTFTNKSGSNSQWTNDEGYTTNAGTVTPSSTDTFTNKSGSNSQWTNDEGYTTSTGDVTLTGTQTLTNKTLTTPVIDQISPSAGLVQIDGAGTVDGGIKLMCYAGTHGQILKSQPHSAGVTNTMLLPAGSSSTLVSNVSTSTLTNKSGNISMWTNDSGYLTSYTEADTLQSVTARGDTTNQRILMNGSGSDAYLYVAGNAATTAPTNDQGMAFVYNNSGGSRENEIYFNPGSVTPAENATYYFALINEYLNSSSSNARVTDTLFKLYGNGNLELTGPTATSTIANTFWRMPKTAAPGTGYYLSKASGSIDLAWTAPPTTGDITSVTAGTGMTGGGTSGGVTLNVIGGNGITANANDITMSGSYTGDLTITGDAVTDSYRFRANHSNPTTSTATLYDQSNVGATISAYRFAVRNSDGTNMLASALFTDTSLTVVGDVIAFGSPSDVRLKENVKPIESALDKVTKLQGVTFDWKKSDSILDVKEDIGLIA